MRVTPNVRPVLQSFMEAPGRHCFGYGLIKDNDLTAGTVYPVLRRLVEAGWVTACDHGPDPEQAPGRPPRRCYELTELGVAEVRRLFENHPCTDEPACPYQ